MVTISDEEWQLALDLEVGTDIAILAANLAFNGFQPLKFMQDMVKLIKRDKRTMNAHLKILIIVGLSRGIGKAKTMDMISQRTVTVGRAQFNAAVSAFGVTNTTDNKESVTIPRLMVAFPKLTYGIWKQLQYNRGIASNLPLHFRYPNAPSAMTEAEWRQNKTLFIDWMWDLQTNLWKQTVSRDKVEEFAQKAYENPCFPLDKRG